MSAHRERNADVKLYSDFGGRRALQILGDALALVVLVLGIAGAVSLYNTIIGLQSIGRDLQASGTDFAANMGEIGEGLAQVPLIGSGIRGPFDAASTAGDRLVAAGQNLESGVASLAALAAWTIAVLAVAVVLLGWVLPRAIGAVRRTTNARLAASPASWDLLALRALTERPIQQVAGLDDDIVAGWRRRDPAAVRRLAALQLRASGVRLADEP